MTTDPGYSEYMMYFDERKESDYRRLAHNRYRKYSDTLGVEKYRMLEIGSGPGHLGVEYAALGIEYLGIDIDRRMVQNARGNVIHGDFLEYQSDNKFDVICASQVLEHITDPKRFVSHAWSLLRPGGILHIDVPNNTSAPSLFRRIVTKPDRWGCIHLPEHLFAYNRRSMLRLLSGASFAPIKVFSATTTHPTWGQITRCHGRLETLNPALELLGLGSLLVTYARRAVK